MDAGGRVAILVQRGSVHRLRQQGLHILFVWIRRWQRDGPVGMQEPMRKAIDEPVTLAPMEDGVGPVTVVRLSRIREPEPVIVRRKVLDGHSLLAVREVQQEILGEVAAVVVRETLLHEGIEVVRSERRVLGLDHLFDQTEALRGQRGLRRCHPGGVVLPFLGRDIEEGVEIQAAPLPEIGRATVLVKRRLLGNAGASDIIQALRAKYTQVHHRPDQHRSDPGLLVRCRQFAVSIPRVPQADRQEVDKARQMPPCQQIDMKASGGNKPFLGGF